MTTHLADPNQDWMNDAACAGKTTSAFFPERAEVDTIRDAKAICFTCPVRVKCLTYAMQNGEKWGVWGGFSERERRQLRRRYNQRARVA